MGDPDRIEVGDTVWISFGAGIVTFVATVLYMPQDTGDCWILRDLQSGDLSYVQNFQRIVLQKKGDQGSDL